MRQLAKHHLTRAFSATTVACCRCTISLRPPPLSPIVAPLPSYPEFDDHIAFSAPPSSNQRRHNSNNASGTSSNSADSPSFKSVKSLQFFMDTRRAIINRVRGAQKAQKQKLERGEMEGGISRSIGVSTPSFDVELAAANRQFAALADTWGYIPTDELYVQMITANVQCGKFDTAIVLVEQMAVEQRTPLSPELLPIFRQITQAITAYLPDPSVQHQLASLCGCNSELDSLWLGPARYAPQLTIRASDAIWKLFFPFIFALSELHVVSRIARNDEENSEDATRELAADAELMQHINYAEMLCAIVHTTCGVASAAASTNSLKAIEQCIPVVDALLSTLVGCLRLQQGARPSTEVDSSLALLVMAVATCSGDCSRDLAAQRIHRHFPEGLPRAFSLFLDEQQLPITATHYSTCFPPSNDIPAPLESATATASSEELMFHRLTRWISTSFSKVRSSATSGQPQGMQAAQVEALLRALRHYHQTITQLHVHNQARNADEFDWLCCLSIWGHIVEAANTLQILIFDLDLVSRDSVRAFLSEIALSATHLLWSITDRSGGGSKPADAEGKPFRPGHATLTQFCTLALLVQLSEREVGAGIDALLQCDIWNADFVEPPEGLIGVSHCLFSESTYAVLELLLRHKRWNSLVHVLRKVFRVQEAEVLGDATSFEPRLVSSIDPVQYSRIFHTACSQGAPFEVVLYLREHRTDVWS